LSLGLEQFDQTVQKHVLKELHRDSASIEERRPVTDPTLISALTKRLAFMENQVKVLTQTIQEKVKLFLSSQFNSFNDQAIL
jgi:hypothetical protein